MLAQRSTRTPDKRLQMKHQNGDELALLLVLLCRCLNRTFFFPLETSPLALYPLKSQEDTYVRAADLVPGRGKRGKYLIILNLW